MGLEKLIQGFQAFRASYFEDSHHYQELMAWGQAPEALVIACSDSRNDPALVTSSAPGDLFVLRNVAAIVPPYHPDGRHHGTSAAIEFAVRGLRVRHIVVMGHAVCGGVQSLADQKGGDYEFLAQWMAIGEPAREAVERLMADAPRKQKLQALEQAVVLTSLNNLMTFPWVAEGVAKGDIALHGWYFDMVKGKLLGYDFAQGAFREMEGDASGFSQPAIRKHEDGTHEGHADGCCHSWPLDDLVRQYALGGK